jgi:hypothetical protein
MAVSFKHFSAASKPRNPFFYEDYRTLGRDSVQYGGKLNISEKPGASIFRIEHGSSRLPRNASILAPDYTASHPTFTGREELESDSPDVGCVLT